MGYTDVPQTRFDPVHPKYRRVADLPQDERGSFEDIGGFVCKSAATQFREAKLAAAVSNQVHSTHFSAFDVLQAQANEDNAAFDEAVNKRRDEVLKELSNTMFYSRDANSLRSVYARVPKGYWRDEVFVLYLLEHGGLWHRDKEDVIFEFISPLLYERKDFVARATKVHKRYFQFANASLRGNKEFVLQMIEPSHRDSILEYVSDELKDDKEVVMVAVTKCGAALEFASQRLQDDLEVVTAAISDNSYAIRFAGPNVKKNKSVALTLLRQKYLRYMELDFLDASFWDDEAIVRLAVARFKGNALKKAAKRFRDDPEMVKIALRKSPEALQYAGKKLRSDKETVLRAVRQESGVEAEPHMGAHLHADKEIMKALVRQDGLMLAKAAPAVRQDHDVVRAAVSQNGLALQYAAAELRGDRKIVLLAISKTEQALKYASKELRADRDVVLAAVEKGRRWYSQDSDTEPPCVFQFADTSLRGNAEVVKAVFVIDPRAFQFVSPALRKDKKFVCGLLTQEANIAACDVKAVFKAMDPELQQDRDVALCCTSAYSGFYSLFSRELQRDPKIIKAAVQRDASLIKDVLKKCSLSKAFILELIEVNPWIYRDLSDVWKLDMEIAMAALSKEKELFSTIPKVIGEMVAQVVGKE
jgi:hypothetical protein